MAKNIKTKNQKRKEKLSKRNAFQTLKNLEESRTKMVEYAPPVPSNKTFQQEQQEVKKEMQNLVINYFADRNGCGYFRSIWPSELLSTYKSRQILNCFMYMKDNHIIRFVKSFRFQRQATNEQLAAWKAYEDFRNKTGARYRLDYEIDDYLMGIEKYNTVAYNYFDAQKKSNHMYMIRNADRVVFSTDFLKTVYTKDHGVDPNRIHVVKNTLPQFLFNLPLRKTPNTFEKRKPRIFWSGSASHVGPGGDLEFLIPLIKKTLDEYQWVFLGVFPPELKNEVQCGKIEFVQWVPTYALANMTFYKARPDICLAPLKPSVFNGCKSDLKLLEACSFGTPIITTSFDNSGVEFHGERVKSPYEENAEICLEPDIDIWKSAIDHIVDNPDYYMDVVQKQYSYINGRWMENYLDVWDDAMF